MQADEMGMKVNSVQLNINKMNDEISKEEKIEKALLNIKDKFNKVYSSERASKINTNNGYIADTIHVKIKNLNSYKLYTEKYVNVYSKVTASAVDMSADLLNKVSE